MATIESPMNNSFSRLLNRPMQPGVWPGASEDTELQVTQVEHLVRQERIQPGWLKMNDAITDKLIIWMSLTRERPDIVQAVGVAAHFRQELKICWMKPDFRKPGISSGMVWMGVGIDHSDRERGQTFDKSSQIAKAHAGVDQQGTLAPGHQVHQVIGQAMDQPDAVTNQFSV